MSDFIYQGKRCCYEDRGAGRPLLFLHGNTASSNMFLDLVPAFEKNRRVLLLDFLGYGRSDRMETLPTDLWYDQAMQAAALLERLGLTGVDVIGSSGGALAAINLALERPELVGKVVADSFEGEVPLEVFTKNLVEDRERSKTDEKARVFYRYMLGEDWETVVDRDTDAIARHARTVGRFFHRPLTHIRRDVLLTGSREDEFVCGEAPDFFDRVYGDMLRKMGRGEVYLFPHGGHPAALSNAEAFVDLALRFLDMDRGGVKIIKGYGRLDEIRALFTEYTNWIGRDLSFQDYGQELLNLPGKYAEPEGLLLLAVDDGDRAVGCGAFRKLERGRCEMKRLYVRPDCRGQQVGRTLVERLIEAARAQGYGDMVLDTLGFMEGALRLYRAEGFEDIPAYYDNPMPDAIYLRRKL